MKTLSFEGNGLEYFKIWIVNVLLTIITIGIYYPWAKVRNNRYFYANSKLEEKSFEYHATGKQLFFGYVIASALLTVYFMISEMFVLGQIIFVAGFLLALPWILWRSMRFNLNITSFSNVKFKFDGKLGGLYFIFFVYPLIFFMAIGMTIWAVSLMDIFIINIIAPIVIIAISMYALSYFKMKNSSYRINASKFGQGEFKTNLEAKGFLSISIKTILISLLTFLVGIGLLGLFELETLKSLDAAFFTKLLENLENPAVIMEMFMPFQTLLIGFYIIGIIVSVLAISYNTTRTREYIYGNTTLDEDINFESTIKFLKLTFIILTNFLIILLTLGLAIPWVKVRLTRYMLENTHISSTTDLKTYISQKQNKESAVGEEIGDAFDVDAGIAL